MALLKKAWVPQKKQIVFENKIEIDVQNINFLVGPMNFVLQI